MKCATPLKIPAEAVFDTQHSIRNKEKEEEYLFIT